MKISIYAIKFGLLLLLLAVIFIGMAIAYSSILLLGFVSSELSTEIPIFLTLGIMFTMIAGGVYIIFKQGKEYYSKGYRNDVRLFPISDRLLNLNEVLAVVRIFLLMAISFGILYFGFFMIIPVLLWHIAK